MRYNPIPFNVRVAGKGSFPIDMLRRDHCWPASEIDAGKIEGSFFAGGAEYIINLNGANAQGGPTVDRWKSFGWEIVPVPVW